MNGPASRLIERACCVLVLAAGLSEVAAADPPITAAAWTPTEDRFLTGSQRGVELRDCDDLSLIRRLPVELAHVHDLAFAPDGRRLLATGGNPAWSNCWTGRKPGGCGASSCIRT
jgi:hypothetical protein